MTDNEQPQSSSVKLFDLFHLVFYFLVWFALSSIFFKAKYLIHGLIVAITYILSYMYAMKVKGHIGVSADGFHSIVVILVFALSCWVHNSLGYFNAREIGLLFVFMFSGFGLAHLFFFAFLSVWEGSHNLVKGTNIIKTGPALFRNSILALCIIFTLYTVFQFVTGLTGEFDAGTVILIIFPLSAASGLFFIKGWARKLSVIMLWLLIILSVLGSFSPYEAGDALSETGAAPGIAFIIIKLIPVILGALWFLYILGAFKDKFILQAGNDNNHTHQDLPILPEQGNTPEDS